MRQHLAIYLRLSLEDMNVRGNTLSDESNSIRNQRLLIEKYVSTKDTPPMLDMLLRAPAEEIEGILALRASAFSRDTPGFINCLSKADRAGKKLLLVEYPEHIELANKLKRDIFGQ